ncbi:MAG: SPOR domain-containing protein, partial [Bacteroidetes bacterium]|nr:SPOR domain-containing protein [Bacteroidota bacterium]
FDDAFIVTYKNGERIGLDIAIKTENTNSAAEKKESTELVVEEKETNEVTANLKFTVQIMVASSTIPAADLPKLSKLGNIDKEQSGNLYKYYAGTYSNLEEANIQLEKAKSVGFSQAFVFVTNNGERITLEQVKELLK